MDSVRTLLAINFINSLCLGVVTPVLTTHLIAHGGSHISAGFMVTGMYIAEKRSKEFLALFEHGNKFTLQFSLLVGFIANLFLAFAPSHWIILFAVMLISLTNRIQVTCVSVLKEKDEKDVKFLEVTALGADVFGCILGGYLFVIGHTFTNNALFCATLNMLGLLLLQRIGDDVLGPPKTATNDFPNFYNNCCDSLKELQKIDFRTHWDVIMLKSAYVASFRVYFTKFSLLVTLNYQICTVLLGYTIAYQHMVIFAASHLILFNTNTFDKKIFDPALLLSSFMLMGLYFAPTYDSYLLIFMPMSCAYVLVNNLMDDCLELNTNTEFARQMNTLTEIVNIVTPLLFGFIAEYAGANGFKVLAVLPSAVCLFIIHRNIIRNGGGRIKND